MQPVVRSVLVFLSLNIAEPLAAQELLTPHEVASLMRHNPVGCLNPDGRGGCEMVTYTDFVMADRGLELNSMLHQVDSGVYARVMATSNLVFEGSGFCYPDMADELLDAQVIITNTLSVGGGSQDRPAPPEGQAVLTDMVLKPLARLLGSGRYCNRFSVSADRARPDEYIVQPYVDGEPFDEPMRMRLYPEEALQGLSYIVIQ